MNKTVPGVIALLCLGALPARSGELFRDDFESGSSLSTPLASGFGWHGTNAGAGDAVGGSTDIAHSGTHSVKFTFAGGPAGDDAWSELRYVLGQNMNEIYIQWYQYFPNGTEGLGPKWSHRPAGASNNNKFLRLWSGDYTQFNVKTGLSFWVIGGGDSKLGPDGGHNGNLLLLDPDDNSGMNDGRRGRWVNFVYHARTATSANDDGVVQLWVDDVLTIDNRSAALYPTAGTGNYFSDGYLMGWSNSGFDQTSYTYIDDVVIADAPVGQVVPRAPTSLQVQ